MSLNLQHKLQGFAATKSNSCCGMCGKHCGGGCYQTRLICIKVEGKDYVAEVNSSGNIVGDSKFLGSVDKNNAWQYEQDGKVCLDLKNAKTGEALTLLPICGAIYIDENGDPLDEPEINFNSDTGMLEIPLSSGGDSRIKCCKRITKDDVELAFLSILCDDGETLDIVLPCAEDDDLVIVKCDE